MPKICGATEVQPAAVFRAFAITVVPEMNALDEQGWHRVEATIERALSARPAKIRRQISLLLRVLDRMPVLRYGRRLASLTTAQRISFIKSLESSPVALLRRGVWGLRTLVLMGYYTDPETMREVGYRADARGWRARMQAAP